MYVEVLSVVNKIKESFNLRTNEYHQTENMSNLNIYKIGEKSKNMVLY